MTSILLVVAQEHEDDRPTIPAPACPRERDAAEACLGYARVDLRLGRREELPEWLREVAA